MKFARWTAIVSLLALTGCLCACGSLPTPGAVQAATTATISKAQTDLQAAINVYGVAKGIGQVASLAVPGLVPIVAAATAVADPLVAQAQTALNAATVDANAIEQLAAAINAQASALTLAAAPAVKVVPGVVPVTPTGA